MSIVVAGKEYIIPQGVTYFEKTPPAKAADVAVGNGLVVGDVGGGVPHNVNVNGLAPIYTFTNPSEAIALLKSGKGLISIKEAFKTGANRVFFLRGQDNTVAKQATLVNATIKITLNSADYADFGNRISVAYEETTGNVVVTLRLYNFGTPIHAEDTATSCAASVLTHTGEAFDTEGLVAFNGTNRTGDMLHIIDDNSTGVKNGYYPIVSWTPTTITVTGTLGTLTTPKYEIVRIASVEEEISDSMTYDNATVNAWFGQAGAIRQYVNSSVTGVANLVDVAEAWLFAGTDGVSTAAMIETALSKCVTVNAQLRHVASGDSTIFGKLPSHIQEADDAGYPSIGFAGGVAGDDVAAVKAYAVDLDTDRMVICTPANQDVDENDILGIIGGWAVAAKVMGIAASLDPSEPLTHKIVQAVGLETTYDKSERIELQQAGVLVINQTQRGKEIQKGVTTLQDNTNLWTSGLNPKTPEISLRRIADAISMTVRNGYDTDFVGKSAKYVKAGLNGYLIATLEDFDKNKGWIVDGVDEVTEEDIPSWEIYRIYKVAGAWYTDVGLNFNDPTNFVVFKGIIL